MIGISACLGGVCCRYDGCSKKNLELENLVKNNRAILICPEVLGGLSTPREPAEINRGDGFDVWENHAQVITLSGENVTEVYKRGARQAFLKLKEFKIDQIIMKEKSPSCASSQIYDGSFSGSKKQGVGVATALFIENGLAVYSEWNWQELITSENLDR